MDKGTVFVGLSGGVDSSVAALRLKKQGYHVVGVFIKVWQPDFIDCNWQAERLDAMRIAAHLDIPFLTCNAEAEYKRDVADYFIKEYAAGRTPNPDVMCNQAVKFGAFLKYALNNKADYIATGHYAQKMKGSDPYKYALYRGVDQNKDQSYFLWTLTQTQLNRSLFPVGDTPKRKIRQEARAAGLPVFAKKDSQGICFLGHIDIPEFLAHFIDLKSGQVLDSAGQVIGKHKGALLYTTGQRHGFNTIKQSTSQQPLYVTGRDLNQNTITVGATKPTEPRSSIVTLTEVNVISNSLAINQELEVQTRYRQTPVNATITAVERSSIKLKLLSEHESVASGQSCVLYDGSKCLGGGIIE